MYRCGAWSIDADISKYRSTFILNVMDYTPWMMQGLWSFETSETISPVTQKYIPEDYKHYNINAEELWSLACRYLQ
jgi:hypothetical protein